MNQAPESDEALAKSEPAGVRVNLPDGYFPAGPASWRPATDRAPVFVGGGHRLARARHRPQRRDLLGGQRRAPARPAAGRPDRLVEIYSGLSKDYPQLTTSYPGFPGHRARRRRARGCHRQQLTCAASWPPAGAARSITGEAVTANYFDLLGIPLELGRGFRADENVVPDASPVIVVSHGLWQRTLGGSPNVDRADGQDLRSRLHRHRRRLARVPGTPARHRGRLLGAADDGGSVRVLRHAGVDTETILARRG